MSIFDLFKKIETENLRPSGPPEWVIVGLGNPGSKYETTRHNAGFLALDVIAGKNRIQVNKMKFSALIGDGEICKKRVVLVKPQKFMNLSGDAVKACADFYKISMDRVIVIYDDISLNPGKLRVRAKGSAGGHNGIKDIITKCSTDTFPRIKIGVGAKPHPDYDLADWVLGNFTKKEQEEIIPALDKAVGAVETIITQGVEAAANKFNG